MFQNLLRPIYRCEPIASTASLAKALGVEIDHLQRLASNADRLYRLARPILKEDGSIRQPFDALPPLKEVHRRLKNGILLKVQYPAYLTGSLKGRDYRTNATLHVGSRLLICEDIQNFFPSVSAARVYDVWKRLFNFSPAVAQLLTQLTVKEGALPQGAISSSFLANLVLWEYEPALQAALTMRGITDSRYVDDIALSSRTFLSRQDQTRLIADVYGMLARVGLRAKRKKHESFDAGHRMVTTKLVMNTRVALPQAKRSSVRAAVFQVEGLSREGHMGSGSVKLLDQVSVRVGQLGRFHPRQAEGLRRRLLEVREVQAVHNVTAGPTVTPQVLEEKAYGCDGVLPPW